MKTLLLTLLLIFQGHIWDGFQGHIWDELPGPYVKSELIKFYDSQAEMQSRFPNLIILQSARAANGEYFLVLEVNSRNGYFDAACPLTLTVDNKDLTLPCSPGPMRIMVISPGVNPPSRSKKHSASHYAVRSTKIESVLRAKSIQVKVGANTFELSDRQLNSLRVVLR